MRDGPDKQLKGARQSNAGTDTAVADLDDGHVFPTSRGVLSAAEIEALLRPKTGQMALETPPVSAAKITPRETPSFDAIPPSMAPVADDQYRVVGARLSRALGAGTGVKAAVTIAQAASIAGADLPGLLNGKSSAIACIGPSETDIHALICLPPLLADAIIAKACGARGSTGRIGDGWTLSAIDCALLEQLLVPFGNAVGAGMSLQSIETDIPYVSSLLPANQVTIAEFSVEAPGLHSELALIQVQNAFAPEGGLKPDAPAAPITALVTARLASLTVPLSRITELKAGSTLLLGLPADQPVELLSGGRDGQVAFEGRMGRKGNKVAIKLTKRLRAFSEG